MRGFASLMASIGVAIVIASLFYGLGNAADPGGTMHAIGDIGFKLTVALSLTLVITPPAGSFFTLAVAEAFRRTTTPRTLLKVFSVMRPLYWLLLVASVWFPIYAHRRLAWPGWRIAWVYAAVLGVMLGGITMLSTISTELRKRLAGVGESWSPR